MTDETNARPTKVCRRDRVKLIESNDSETILESFIEILKRRFDRTRMENDIIARYQDAVITHWENVIPTKDTPGMNLDQVSRHRTALIMIFPETGERLEPVRIAIEYDMDIEVPERRDGFQHPEEFVVSVPR